MTKRIAREERPGCYNVTFQVVRPLGLREQRHYVVTASSAAEAIERTEMIGAARGPMIELAARRLHDSAAHHVGGALNRPMHPPAVYRAIRAERIALELSGVIA